MKFAKSIIILSRISVASKFYSSSRYHYWIMFVNCPGFFIEDWQVRYADIIVSFLLSLPVMVIYDHLPGSWDSLPEVMIPELIEWSVTIAVPPSLFELFHSISISKVVIYEYR